MIETCVVVDKDEEIMIYWHYLRSYCHVCRTYYKGLGNFDGDARPISYRDLPNPLGKGSVRPIVLHLQSSSAQLSDLAATAARDIVSLLPSGEFKVHIIEPESYHITIFMPSKPRELRPDPFAPDGGVNLGHSAPTPAILAREMLLCSKLAAQMETPRLEVHSIVFARTGALLLCFVERTGSLAWLRKMFRTNLPGSAVHQSEILHCTLARVVHASMIQSETLSAIHSACTSWTESLRGKAIAPECLWYIQEDVFSTINGELRTFRFGGSTAPCAQ
eukprot:jgi/Botrbrau1/20459/Bobra.145_2s0022.2